MPDILPERAQSLGQDGAQVVVEEEGQAAWRFRSNVMAASACEGVRPNHSAALERLSPASTRSYTAAVETATSATWGAPKPTLGSTTTRPALPWGHHLLAMPVAGSKSRSRRYASTASTKTYWPRSVRLTISREPG